MPLRAAGSGKGPRSRRGGTTTSPAALQEGARGTIQQIVRRFAHLEEATVGQGLDGSRGHARHAGAGVIAALHARAPERATKPDSR